MEAGPGPQTSYKEAPGVLWEMLGPKVSMGQDGGVWSRTQALTPALLLISLVDLGK